MQGMFGEWPIAQYHGTQAVGRAVVRWGWRQGHIQRSLNDNRRRLDCPIGNRGLIVERYVDEIPVSGPNS